MFNIIMFRRIYAMRLLLTDEIQKQRNRFLIFEHGKIITKAFQILRYFVYIQQMQVNNLERISIYETNFSKYHGVTGKRKRFFLYHVIKKPLT